MRLSVVVCAFALVVVAQQAGAQNATAATAIPGLLLPSAWAHHDHELDIKLYGALSNGFCGVYADFNVMANGSLMIPPTTANQTVQQYYFDQFATLASQSNGSIYKASAYTGVCKSIYFLADTGGNLTAKENFDTLHTVLLAYNERYPGLFTVWYTNGTRVDGAVTVIMSGTRPTPDVIASVSPRLIALSGMAAWVDTYANASTGVMPIISTRVVGSATAILGVSGTLANLTSAQRANVTAFTARVHAQGRAVRYTQAFPSEDTEANWSALFNLGTDIVDTQAYSSFRTYVLGRVSSLALPSSPPATTSATASTGRRLRFA